MSDQSFVKRHSALIYFILAFMVSWIGVYFVMWSKFSAGEVMDLGDLGVAAAAMLNGPFLVGLLMTYFVDGKGGLKELAAKMTKYKVAGRWYLPLLIFPGLLFIVALLLGIFVSSELLPTFAVMGIVGGPMAGLLEETGWMGFAYPKMKEKSSALRTSIYLGVIHGFWHILADFLGNYNIMGTYWPFYFIGAQLHIWALRVLIVWVYSNTKSVFLSILMHASSTGFFGILISTTMAPINWVIYYNVYGVALCLVASAIALKYGKTLKCNSI